MKLNRHILSLVVLTSVLAFCFGMVACSSGNNSPNGSAEGEAGVTTTEASVDLEKAIADAKAEDPYVADEVCLSCHGGTYEALAELTDDLGDSNPHAGTHGSGGISCNLCHTDGQTVPTDETNECLDCHDWPREDESYIEYMDL